LKKEELIITAEIDAEWDDCVGEEVIYAEMIHTELIFNPGMSYE